MTYSILPKTLYELLEECTVEIRVDDKETVEGTGFFVAPSIVLTCAHVIKEGQHGVAWLRKIPYSMTELKRFPDPYPDFALYSITLQDHFCVKLTENWRPRDRLYSFGFPGRSLIDNGYADYSTPITPEIRGRGFRDQARQRVIIDVKDDLIQGGRSGSPLLNQRNGCVCGFIQTTKDEYSNIGGGVIPIEAVFDALAKEPIQIDHIKFDLKEEQKRYHTTNPLWGNLIQAEKQLDYPTSHSPFNDLEFQQYKKYIKDFSLEIEKQWENTISPMASNSNEANYIELQLKVVRDVVNNQIRYQEIYHNSHFTLESALNTYRDKVLILADSGAGKTTLLLRYVKILLTESESHFFPVFIKLASWKAGYRGTTDPATMFTEFLIENLIGNRKSSLTNETLRKWISNGENMVLVLDGLDEVNDNQYDSLINAMNAFMDTYIETKILISSQPRTYLQHKLRLNVNAALELGQPSKIEIENYLREIGDKEIISHHISDYDFLQLPLHLRMLSIISFRNRKTLLYETMSYENRRSLLFNEYTKAVIRRRELKLRGLNVDDTTAWPENNVKGFETTLARKTKQTERDLEWLALYLSQPGELFFYPTVMYLGLLNVPWRSFRIVGHAAEVIYIFIVPVVLLSAVLINSQGNRITWYLFAIIFILIPLTLTLNTNDIFFESNRRRNYFLAQIKSLFKSEIIPFMCGSGDAILIALFTGELWQSIFVSSTFRVQISNSPLFITVSLILGIVFLNILRNHLYTALFICIMFLGIAGGSSATMIGALISFAAITLIVRPTFKIIGGRSSPWNVLPIKDSILWSDFDKSFVSTDFRFSRLFGGFATAAIIGIVTVISTGAIKSLRSIDIEIFVSAGVIAIALDPQRRSLGLLTLAIISIASNIVFDIFDLIARSQEIISSYSYSAFTHLAQQISLLKFHEQILVSSISTSLFIFTLVLMVSAANLLLAISMMSSDRIPSKMFRHVIRPIQGVYVFPILIYSYICRIILAISFQFSSFRLKEYTDIGLIEKIGLGYGFKYKLVRDFYALIKIDHSIVSKEHISKLLLRIDQLSLRGEAAFDQLQSIIIDENTSITVRQKALMALGCTGYVGIALLLEYSRHSDNRYHKAAEDGLNQIEKYYRQKVKVYKTVQSMLYLSGILNVINKPNEALLLSNEALSMNDDVLAYVERGISLQEIGDFSGAMMNYEMCIEKENSYLFARYRRGWLLRILGQSEEALKEFMKCVELNEKYAWAYFGLCRTYIDIGEMSLANEQIQHAFELPEDNELKPLLLSAQFSICLKLANRGLEYQNVLNQLLTINPDDYSFYQASLGYFLINDVINARLYINKAQRIADQSIKNNLSTTEFCRITCNQALYLILVNAIDGYDMGNSDDIHSIRTLYSIALKKSQPASLHEAIVDLNYLHTLIPNSFIATRMLKLLTYLKLRYPLSNL